MGDFGRAFRAASPRGGGGGTAASYVVAAAEGSPLATERSGNDVVFSGGVSARIRSSANPEHILASCDDCTLILRSVRHFELMASGDSALAAAANLEPAIEVVAAPSRQQHRQPPTSAAATFLPFRRKADAAPADAPAPLALYRFRDITHVTHANTKRGIVVEVDDVGRTASRLLPASGATQRGPSSLFTLQLAFATAESRGVVYNTVVTALRHFKRVRELRADQVAAGGRTGAIESIGQVLDAVRGLQDRTHKLLDELKRDDGAIVDPETGELCVADCDSVGAIAGHRSLHLWAERALQRRRSIHDASDRVEAIRRRRMDRQRQLERAFRHLHAGDRIGRSASPSLSLRSPRASDSGRFSSSSYLSVSPRSESDGSDNDGRPEQPRSAQRTPTSQRHSLQDAASASPRRRSDEGRRRVASPSDRQRPQQHEEEAHVRCPHCQRIARASHPPLCAYRKIRCPACGVVVAARDGRAHREQCKQRHRTAASDGASSRRYALPQH